MKIAFTGASSTGKTTTALSLNDFFYSQKIKITSVDARKMLTEKGYKNVGEISPEKYILFQEDYLAKKIELEKDLNSFCAERSYIDILAYAIAGSAIDENKAKHNNLYHLCKKYTSTYVMHFYFPFGLIPFQKDGYRHNSIENHEKVDYLIKKFLQEWDVPFITLKETDLVKRSHIIQNWALDNNQ